MRLAELMRINLLVNPVNLRLVNAMLPLATVMYVRMLGISR